MKQSNTNTSECREENGGERRYASILGRFFTHDANRFTVIDQHYRVLGGLDEATITFESDPRVSHPFLFLSDSFGLLLDPKVGTDGSYFERLEALASLALDDRHALRALNIDGSRK